MPILTPGYRFARVAQISPEALRRAGIRGILLDVDNTLSPHNAPDPLPDAVQWLHALADAGISAVIVSNNREPRVAPFADRLGLPRTALAVVGDQLFTDVLGGNLAGMTTLLVDPIQPEHGWFFRLKRALERPLLRGVRYSG